MKDLSLHLLDILENSATAGATAVTVHLTWTGTWLHLDITDNGPGFPDSVKPDPADPFRTTRTDRDVGLGLSLLSAMAKQTGGGLQLGASAAGGVRVSARFDLGHVDAQPIGPLEDALCAAMLAWPRMDLSVFLGADRREVLSTREVKGVLGSVEIGTTRVQVYLHALLRQELAPLSEWAATIERGTAMKSLDELRTIRDEVKKSLEIRAGGHRAKIVVGMGTCGIAAGARDTMLAFIEALDEAGVSDVAVTATGCAGFCDQEPLVDVETPEQPAVRYGRVDAAAAKKIVREHIVGGKRVETLMFG